MPAAQLFLVFYAVIALCSPVLVGYVLYKQARVRADFNRLAEELRAQVAAAERQVASLTGRIHTLESGSAARKPPEGPVVDPAARPKPAAALTPPPVLPAIPAAPKLPVTPPVTSPITPVDRPIVAGTQPPVQKPVGPSIVIPEAQKEVPKVLTPPAAPPARPAMVSAPPAAPIAPPRLAASSDSREVGVNPSPLATPPPSPAHPPAAAQPPIAARSATPAPLEAFRYAAPKPTMQERIRKVSAIEESLGTNWLQKAGIILLVIGIAWFGIYEFNTVGAIGKDAILFFTAVALLVSGILFENRKNYRLLGRTLIGGGWALLFFATYGIYHVSAMHVLDSLILDSVLMLAVAVAMGAHTLRYRSQFVTGLAFLLGYTTVALSQDTVYSLSAGVILAIGLVLIVSRMGWFELEVFGILSSYLNHLYWLYRLLGPAGAHGRLFDEYHASLAMLLFYWLTFRISYLVREVKTEFAERVSSTAAILNTLLLLAAMKFQSVQPELAYLALLGIGLFEFSFAQLPITRRRREAFVVLTVMGAALMLGSPASHYSGNNLAILWLLGAQVFLIAGVLVKEVVFRRIGLCAGLVVGIHLAVVDAGPVLHKDNLKNLVLVAAGVLFSVVAVVLYANLVVIGKRWASLFEAAVDENLLNVHSYIAGASAALAVWALSNGDSTAALLCGVMLILALLTKQVPSQHLQIQYAAMGLLTFFRTATINFHPEAPHGYHLAGRLVSLPIIGAGYYLTAKLAALREDSEQRLVRGLFAAAGTAVIAMLIASEVPDLWKPVAYIAFAMALSEAARWLRYQALAWHAHGIAFCAVVAAVSADPLRRHLWHNFSVHGLSVLAVVAGLYWLAWRPGPAAGQGKAIAGAVYTWVAAGLMSWALWELAPEPWIAVAWMAFAVVLALFARRLQYPQLAWQCNAVALLAALRTVEFNYGLERTFWPAITLRVVTVSLVAAGHYFLSRQAAPEARSERAVAFLHSFAGTGLLALLAWYEQPNGWLAPLWAGFALVLALVDHRFDLEELGWQAHLLSVLALIRCLTFNLHQADTWHGWSLRLLSVTLVAVFFYAMCRFVRMPEDWRSREFHHGYSWAASALVGSMLWYELVPLNIAIGWGVFGLVLFEYGELRKVRQFRLQAYLALLASFVRIFFANLSRENAGQFWNPRTTTILPLVAIYFFVYMQLTSSDSGEAGEKNAIEGSSVASLLATLGTATVVALCYFDFPVEWVVTSWAAVVVVLFAMMFWLDRTIFLYQAVALTAMVLVRGLLHNLFGSGYFTGVDWSGRYSVLVSTIALLLATLLFAFPLRQRFRNKPIAANLPTSIAAVFSRPEQLQFFVPVILLTFMLAMKLRPGSGMVTASWGIEGVLIFLLALAVSERSYRLTGLGLLLVCVAKVVLLDVWGLEARDRYLTFIIVGAALLFVSFLYSRYRETIRQLL